MYKSHINSIHLELTDRCNAECPACPRTYGGGYIMPYVKNQELSLDYFKLLGPAFISRIGYWNFCGTKGDPASAQDLFEILDYIISCNPNVHIELRTNGGARSTDFWKKVGERFKDTYCVVTWGIDGWENTNHIYRKNVKWDKLYSNLLSYISTGAKSVWEFSLFHHNIEDLEIVKEFCKEHNIELRTREPYGFESLETLRPEDGLKKSVRTLPVYQRDTDNNAKLIYEIFPHNKDDVILVSNHRTEVFSNELDDYVYDMEEWEDIKGTHIDYNCEVSMNKTRQEVFIDSDGTVFPCCYIASKYIMGDEQLHQMIDPIKDTITVTNNNTIYDVLSSKFFKEVMPNALTGKLDDNVGHCITCVHHCKR